MRSIEEDCELVDLDLCSSSLEWHARVPGWRDHYLGTPACARLSPVSSALSAARDLHALLAP